MMKFDELWEIVVARNPSIESGTVKMSSGNFKRSLKYAYDRGKNYRYRHQKTASDDFVDTMSKMFGMKK